MNDKVVIPPMTTMIAIAVRQGTINNLLQMSPNNDATVVLLNTTAIVHQKNASLVMHIVKLAQDRIPVTA